MAWVTQDFIDRWYGKDQVGENTPCAVVQVQRGKWSRGYDPWPGPRIDASIWNEPHESEWDDGSGHHVAGRGGFWRAWWNPSGPWVDVPNLYTIKKTRDLAQKGITVVEIVIDAIDYEPKVGALGDAYHVLSPGFLTNTRGFVAPTRKDPHWNEGVPFTTAPDGSRNYDTEWHNLLTDGVKVRIWQGFGDPETDEHGNTPPIDGGPNGAWVFVGQVDDVDTDAGDSTQGNMNQITITMRNGKLLTDQTLFGWTKSQQLPDPVTFCDDTASSAKALVGYRAVASGSDGRFPPANVLDRPTRPWNDGMTHSKDIDPAYKTEWHSDAADGQDGKKWIQVRVPQGLYEDCWLYVHSDYRPVCWISIYAKPLVYRSMPIQSQANAGPMDGITGDPVAGAPNSNTRRIEPPRCDGKDLRWDDGTKLEGWIDLGAGNVPGQDYPFIRYIGDINRGGPINICQFFHNLEIGDRSIIRLTFSRLPTIDGAHRMSVGDLHGRRRKVTGEAAINKWIMVPDAADPVRVCLRWAGYDNWEVEEAGVRLNGWLTYDRTKSGMDVIQDLCTQTGNIFFIADPTDGDSEGVPTWRKDSSLLYDNNYIAAELRDDGNLTGIKRKDTDENRPFIIRVRGTSAPPAADIPGSHVDLEFGGGFVGLGGDTIKRIMAVYLPPWAIQGTACAGVLRRVIYQDDNLQSYPQCVMGCMLIALNAALAMHTVEVSLPAFPLIELDDQVSIVDEASGTNSRMWVTQIVDTMTLGDQQSSQGSGGSGSWTQTMEGALIDTPDFAGVLADALKIDWKKLAKATGPDPGSGQPPLPGVVRKGKRPPRTKPGKIPK